MFLSKNDGEIRQSITVDVFENADFGTVRTVLIDGEPWFVGVDIAKALGYKRPSDAVGSNVPDKHKEVVQISDIQDGLPAHMRSSKITLIDKPGVSSLILNSGKITKGRKEELISALGLDIVASSRKEIEFGEELKDFFCAWEINVRTQYSVGKYRVDFYIPALNLVIEYDENEHKRYDEDKERERSLFISKTLGCDIIRVSDKNSNSYNIGEIAKEVFSL